MMMMMMMMMMMIITTTRKRRRRKRRRRSSRRRTTTTTITTTTTKTTTTKIISDGIRTWWSPSRLVIILSDKQNWMSKDRESIFFTSNDYRENCTTTPVTKLVKISKAVVNFCCWSKNSSIRFWTKFLRGCLLQFIVTICLLLIGQKARNSGSDWFIQLLDVRLRKNRVLSDSIRFKEIVIF